MSIKLNGGILGTGKLTERSGPDKITDTELVRCWDSDTNFHRRERAIELADAMTPAIESSAAGRPVPDATYPIRQ